MEGVEDGNVIEDSDDPGDILPVMRLKEDVFVLKSLLEGEIPKLIYFRLGKSGLVLNEIGGASRNVCATAVHLKTMLSYRYDQ